MGRPKKQTVDSSQTFMEPATNQPQNDQDGVEIKEKVEELNKEFISEQEKPKSKYKKKKEEEANQSKEFSKFVSGIASMTFDIFISRQKNPIPLTTAEKEKLDGSFDALVQKYIPKVERFKEEVAFVVAVSMIVIPRTTIIDSLFKKQSVEKKVTEPEFEFKKYDD